MACRRKIYHLSAGDISSAERRYMTCRREIFPASNPPQRTFMLNLIRTGYTMKAAYCFIAGFALCCCANPPKPSQPETAVVTTPDAVVAPSFPDLEPWHIDVTQSYPKKEMVLQDIAEVEYLQDDLIIAANEQCGIMVDDGQGNATQKHIARWSAECKAILIHPCSSL